MGLISRHVTIISCPDGQIVAMGGATEAAIWSNYFNVTTLDPSWSSIPYGYPLSNQRYRIVNARGEDCPDWVSGEPFGLVVQALR